MMQCCKTCIYSKRDGELTCALLGGEVNPLGFCDEDKGEEMKAHTKAINKIMEKVRFVMQVSAKHR